MAAAVVADAVMAGGVVSSPVIFGAVMAAAVVADAVMVGVVVSSAVILVLWWLLL